MTDEVIDLAKLLEYLNINEEQVLRLAQSFKTLNIDQRREIEGDFFRKCPSHLHTQLRKVLNIVEHISECRSPHCLYPGCVVLKKVFRHSNLCKTQADGGCNVCMRMWGLLKIHAKACKESICNAPRCRDLKEYLLRSDSQ